MALGSSETRPRKGVEQKSPNVWSVGDSALTAVWDAKAREYRESEVRVNAIKGNFVEVEIRGARHLRPMRLLRRG